jgi:type IV fimbrial biogenesis protein FimT
MTNISPTLSKKMLKTNRIDCSFVVNLIPFVGSMKSHKVPIVCINRPFGRNYGFTLIELIVTLVVAGLLVGIGVPNFRNFIQNSRVTSLTNDAIANFSLARSEAVARRKNVVVCRSAAPTAATPTCAADATGTWETGWIIFMDNNVPPDNAYSNADGDVLIRVHEALANGATLRSSGAELTNRLVFTSVGVATGGSLSTKPYLALCDERGAAHGRAITFETTGRAQIMSQATFPAMSCQ